MNLGSVVLTDGREVSFSERMAAMYDDRYLEVSRFEDGSFLLMECHEDGTGEVRTATHLTEREFYVLTMVIHNLIDKMGMSDKVADKCGDLDEVKIKYAKK